MPQRPVGVTDTPAGAGVAEIRTRERTVNSETVAEQYVIPVRERVPAFIGMTPTFRILGTAAAAPHWLMSLDHAAGSGRIVLVRTVVYYQDHTAATTAINVIPTLCRPTGTIGGGTTLSKTSVGIGEDAAQTSASQVVIRGANASDGGAATAITGLTMANRMWRAFGSRLHTASGQASGQPKDMMPLALRDHGIVVREGERLSLALEYVAAADNPASFHHVAVMMWEEYTLP